MKHLTKQEVADVLHSALSFRDHLLLRIVYQTGIRVGEMSRMKVCDFDIDKRTIHIRFGKRHPEGRTIPITDSVLYRMLMHHIKNRSLIDFLIMSNMGKPMSKRQMQRVFESCAERAGIERERRHIHVLRHSYAMHCSANGLHIGTVNKILGHTDLSGTAWYLESLKDEEFDQSDVNPPVGNESGMAPNQFSADPTPTEER